MTQVSVGYSSTLVRCCLVAPPQPSLQVWRLNKEAYPQEVITNIKLGVGKAHEHNANMFSKLQSVPRVP